MNKFSILNLSDLHLDSNEQAFQKQILQKFADDLNKYLAKADHIKWKPEYIVLPGDIINKGNTNDYENAEKILLDFCKEIRVPPQQMIMVPGNHDKKKGRITTITQYNKVNKNFDAFSQLGPTVERTDKVLNTFLSDHEESFHAFNDFHQKVAFEPRTDFEYDTFPLFEGTKLEYVTGIKIFHKNKVCFLCLNTEWLYAENDLKQEQDEQYPAKREFKAGKNIVRELHTQIMLKCPDYTIITLMHQNPNNISWFETNPVDQTGMSAFNFMESCSDIIFSGHDHAVRTDIPDLIKNRVQHFRLGTPCWMRDKGNPDFPYSASIICIDDITNHIHLLTSSYNLTPTDQQPSWDFDNAIIQTFNLRNKYDKRNWEKPVNKRKFHQTTNLRVKNFDPLNVKSKIYEYFLYDEKTKDISIFIHKINVGKLNIANEEELNGLINLGSNVSKHLEKKDDKLTHLILYYEINSSDCPEDEILASYVEKHKENPLITKLKTHIKKLTPFRLIGKLVVNIISVETPGKFIDSKYNNIQSETF